MLYYSAHHPSSIKSQVRNLGFRYEREILKIDIMAQASECVQAEAEHWARIKCNNYKYNSRK